MSEQVKDTGDLIQPSDDDATPAEITDPSHPDYVAPYAGATRPYVKEG